MDVKHLWGLAAARCSHPQCRRLLIEPSMGRSAAVTTGKICHIEAHSPGGPRYNPDLSDDQRDSYDNWVLLCGHHHDIVDGQPNHYTSVELRAWKEQHEEWVASNLAVELGRITFAELEVTTKALLARPYEPSTDFEAPEIAAKLLRNGLTQRSENLIAMGLAQQGVVASFIRDAASLDAKFPERLTAGFQGTFAELSNEGLEGDALFAALIDFASPVKDFSAMAAGLAVLSHLFHLCEVFD